MPAFIEAGRLERLVPGEGMIVTSGSNTVALFRSDGAIYAVEAWCLRCGSCLAHGTLAGSIVACGGCEWCYEIITGSVVGVPALRLHTFGVEVVDGQIIVADT